MTDKYKKPESVLVVIFIAKSKEVLMLQRKDDPSFWQSVTGSLEGNEIPYQTAIREVAEEIGLDIIKEKLTLIDCKKSVMFELFPNMRKRYAPGITHNLEHWFILPLITKPEIKLTEHLALRWVSIEDAIKLTKSDNNAQAIIEFVR
ncbi:dihydroneopterin triphosphate diphosphatase [Thorsellia anophelis]|uniref:Dihydroneopterin triphosphate pyrophosphatase n=1 Tax=Thorsellia anophelis DSM 18579 TaxID=1123402 RepID=A0A1I0DWK2_9GAMM|nr:dihydroneopterin triphosphate diphosphatase [Thorsellia anophelis]SET36250.1 dihydroneopterin triphosphate pyrophosphatase [Thorsellia anophelis DSM 18579]